MTAAALTIAGSDPSGGAGIQADLKTFHQHGLYGMAVITLLTVQNTQSVDDVQVLDPAFVLAQLDSVLRDIPPAAAKTGALGSAAMIQALARHAAQFPFPLVVDPVMISKHGAPLLAADAIEALRRDLLPRAFLVTPNLHEAAALTGTTATDLPSMAAVARDIAALGPRNVLLKGGRLNDQAVDVLLADGQVHHFLSERIETRSVHGTGCVYAAAITARLAAGESLIDAVQAAKRFITRAIRTAPPLGHGFGPTNLHAPIEDMCPRR